MRTSAAASSSKQPSTASKRGRSSPSDDEAGEIDASDAFGLNDIRRAEASDGPSSHTYTKSAASTESAGSGQAGNGTIAIRTAPEVILGDPMAQRALLTRPTDTTMHVNIPYSDLSLPVVGPSNPYSHRKLGALQNSVNGHFEGTSMSDFDFRNQQRTFDNLGYAKDPSMYSDGSQVAGGYVGDVARARQLDGASALEMRGGLHTDRQAAKERKKQRVGQEGDTSVVEGEGAYVGPWGGWSGEKVHVTEGVGPSEQELQRAEELSTVRKKEKKEMEERRAREDEQGTEKSIFHGESHNVPKCLALENDELTGNIYTASCQANQCTTTKGGHTSIYRATSRQIYTESLVRSPASFPSLAFTPGLAIQREYLLSGCSPVAAI